MKILTNIILLLVFLSCKAQNIVPIFVEEGDVIEDSNPKDYYKDVDNDFDPYVGRWKWEDGDTSLEIIFNKVIGRDAGGGDITDALVGEYLYIENSVEKVNSFPAPMLNDPTTGIPNIISDDTNINSFDIRTNNNDSSFCTECPINSRYIFLSIFDKTKPNVLGRIIMARFVESGTEKIRMRIYNSFNITNSGEDLSIPENSILTLTKVQ